MVLTNPQKKYYRDVGKVIAQYSPEVVDSLRQVHVDIIHKLGTNDAIIGYLDLTEVEKMEAVMVVVSKTVQSYFKLNRLTVPVDVLPQPVTMPVVKLVE